MHVFRARAIQAEGIPKASVFEVCVPVGYLEGMTPNGIGIRSMAGGDSEMTARSWGKVERNGRNMGRARACCVCVCVCQTMVQS